MYTVKNNTGYQNVEIVWSKGDWPLSPADLLFRVLQWRCKLTRENKKLAITPQSPLFCLDDGSILTTNDLRIRFGKLIRAMGLNPNLYPLYPLKDGSTTSYAQRGVSHSLVQTLGRWKGDSFKRCLKYSNENIASMQRQIIKQEVVNDKIVYINGEKPPQYASQS